MAPITWRNVNAPSNNDAVNLLSQAGRSLNTGLSGLTDALRTVQQGRENEYKHTVNTNTQNFLNEIAKYQTPEALKAAQEQGIFSNLLSQYGTAVDQAKVRGAVPGALAQLQNRTLADTNYQNQVRDTKEAPLQDVFQSLVNRRDFAGARKFLDDNDLRSEAGLEKSLTDAQRAAVLRGREDTQYNRAEDAFNKETKLNEYMSGISDFISGRARDNQAAYSQALMNPNIPMGDNVAVLDALAKAGVEDINATNTEDAWINQVKKDAGFNITPVQEQRLREQFQSTWGRTMNGISPADEAQYQAAQATLDKNTKIAANPFYQAEQTPIDPLAEAADIIKENKAILDEVSGGFERDDATPSIKVLMDAMSNGIVLDGSKPDQRIKVPPALLRIAMREVNDGVFRDGQLTTNGIKDLVESAGLTKYADEYEQWKTDSEALLKNKQAKFGRKVSKDISRLNNNLAQIRAAIKQ